MFVIISFPPLIFTCLYSVMVRRAVIGPIFDRYSDESKAEGKKKRIFREGNLR